MEVVTRGVDKFLLDKLAWHLTTDGLVGIASLFPGDESMHKNLSF